MNLGGEMDENIIISLHGGPDHPSNVALEVRNL